VRVVLSPPPRLRGLLVPIVVSRAGHSPPSLIVDELSSIFISVASRSRPDEVKVRFRAYREMLASAAMIRAYAERAGVACIVVVDDTVEGYPVGGRALKKLISASILVERDEAGLRRLVVEEGPAEGVEVRLRLGDSGSVLL